ncbi:glycoside hydrolase family 3 protein, partial [bacterium]|nr:glycoside hydrolase family 3 protein [bacterium]
MFILGTGNLDIALRKNIGGVIFFTKDIKSKTQFKNLIKGIKLGAKTPLFLSIDQEGGRVERTENIHDRFLSPQYAFENGEDFLFEQNATMLNELNEFGINMNFAPCLDVNSNPNNPIINERAFSNNADDVCKGFDIVNKAYKNSNIIPVVKHFPGHGDACKDSHLELPLISLSLNEMEQIHIKPFKHAINTQIEALMVAHLHCTCFDKEPIPTSLSKNCINYLRNNLNFNGVVISDDMFMNGVKSFGDVDACLKGIEAG